MEDRASKTKGAAWLLLACLTGIGLACGLSPIAHAIPWSWEKKLGAALDMSGKRECLNNLRARALLDKLVARIYPISPKDADFSIEVHVVDDAQINAYAQLGGEIYINSGLLKQAGSAEEVAGVLAHEIGHVENRHIMEGMLVHFFTAQGISTLLGNTSSASWADYFLRMDFTRSQEAQADESGLTRLQKAHVSNEGFRDFFERMGKSGTTSVFLSDHPANEARLTMTETFSNQDTHPVMPPEEWQTLKHYCDGK